MSGHKEDLANEEVCRFLLQLSKFQILFQHVMPTMQSFLTRLSHLLFYLFALFKYGYKQLAWLGITSIFMLIQIQKVKLVLWADGWMGWFDMTGTFFKKRHSYLNDGSNRSIFLLSSMIKDSFRKPLTLQIPTFYSQSSSTMVSPPAPQLNGQYSQNTNQNHT